MATMKMIEPHLYEYQHTMKNGEPSVRYYAKFTDWSRRPLTIALGDNVNAARAKLERLHDLNKAKVRVELDEAKELREELEKQKQEKQQERRGVTFAEWAQKYFDEVVPKENGVDCQTMDGTKRISTVHGQELRMKRL